MAHKTLIGGTAYEISGGKTLVGGTAYSIDKGKALIGGTAYEIGFDSIDKHVNTATGEILDSWAVIGAGTYAHYYSLGNWKNVSTSYGTLTMEIVAFGADYCQDGTYAPITWVQRNIVFTGAHSGNTSLPSYGWVSSQIRSRLQSGGNIYSAIPSEVMGVIKTVRKYDMYYYSGYVDTKWDKLWIPCYREIFGSTSYETTGPTYNGYFSTNTKRVKYLNGSASTWYLRSVNQFNNGFGYVNAQGNYGTGFPNVTCGIALGFCT